MWTAVQRIRLHDVDEDVDAVRSLMRVAGTPRASWWLSERSTPADVEEQLLARGLQRIEGDYHVEGMLLTTEPPRADVEVRKVASADEFVEAVETQHEAFNTAAARRRDAAALREEFELDRESDVVATYVASIDGRIAATARAAFTPRGVLLFGGSTAPWARGRGAYRALVRARWDDAVARGTPTLAVQAGHMSAPILRRLGFVTVCSFRRLEDVL